VPVFILKARNIFVPVAAVTQLSTGSVTVVCQYTDIYRNSRHAAVHRFCYCCLSVHRYFNKQPSRSCLQVLLLLSVSTQILTQTAVTVSLLQPDCPHSCQTKPWQQLNCNCTQPVSLCRKWGIFVWECYKDMRGRSSAGWK